MWSLMVTQGLPKFPSKRSLAAKVRKYVLAAHRRGDHSQTPRPDCPLCEAGE